MRKEQNTGGVQFQFHMAGMAGSFPYRAETVVQTPGTALTGALNVMRRYETLRFLYLSEGSAEVRTLDGSERVGSGEGILINRDVVHWVDGAENCRYTSFMFPEYFLEFYEGSPVRGMLEPLIGSKRLALYVFRPGQEWHERVLEGLRRLTELEENRSGYYAYEVLVQLSALWLEIRKNIVLPPEPRKRRNAVGERMEKFLLFIEAHYREDVLLEELAAAAGVSKSECLRCFKRSLQTSPYKYLMDYRLSKAAELLRNSDRQVGEIAVMTGFEQASYFGKCFREKLGCTPKEYRNQCGRPRKQRG